jgi:hypothetical protein
MHFTLLINIGILFLEKRGRGNSCVFYYLRDYFFFLLSAKMAPTTAMITTTAMTRKMRLLVV